MNKHNNKNLTLLSVCSDVGKIRQCSTDIYLCVFLPFVPKYKEKNWAYKINRKWIEPVFSIHKYTHSQHIQFSSVKLFVRNAGELTYQSKSWTTKKKASTVLWDTFKVWSVSASVRIFLSLHDNKRAQSVLHREREKECGRQAASQPVS